MESANYAVFPPKIWLVGMRKLMMMVGQRFTSFSFMCEHPIRMNKGNVARGKSWWNWWGNGLTLNIGSGKKPESNRRLDLEIVNEGAWVENGPIEYESAQIRIPLIIFKWCLPSKDSTLTNLDPNDKWFYIKQPLDMSRIMMLWWKVRLTHSEIDT